MNNHRLQPFAPVVSGTAVWNFDPGAHARRRQFARWHISLPIRELEPNMHILQATSVSAGGLFCPFAPPRPMGDEMLLEIDLLIRTKHDHPIVGPIVARARVVYAGVTPGGLGIGIAFAEPQLSLERFLYGLASKPAYGPA